jgi:hypothetical protein
MDGVAFSNRRLACNPFRSGTQSDPYTSSVTTTIMITASNFAAKRSGLPNQLLGVGLHTTAGSELSRVREERRLPQRNVESGGWYKCWDGSGQTQPWPRAENVPVLEGLWQHHRAGTWLRVGGGSTGQLLINPAAVEKPSLLKNGRSGGKCPPNSRTSFVGHPSASFFRLFSYE